NAGEDRYGFTNLNRYLTWMAEPHYTGPSETTIKNDLEKLTRGYTDATTFTISDTVYGSVTVSGGVAEFKSKSKRLGAFQFTVTYKHGDSMTRTVNIVSGYDVKF